MNNPGERVVVAITTPLESDLVARVAAVDDRVEVRSEPDLVLPSRFGADPRGEKGFRRTPEQEARWQRLLGDADIVFGSPGDSTQGLAKLIRSHPRVRWVQMTAGDAAEQVHAAGLTEAERDRVRITGVSGVHAGPLAEFAMFGILAFAKHLPRLIADARTRRWDRFPMSDLAGKTMLVIGVGSIGAEVARLGHAFGMHVHGVNRTGRGHVPGVENIRPPRFLGDLLPTAHAVVIALPSTAQTAGMIGAEQISRMRADTVLVNVGGGGVIDEDALIRGLKEGQPAAAVLDSFTSEPLDSQSPLWHLPNVLISPHTAALSLQENERIVALFTENLRRYLRGDDLIGRL